MLIKCPECELSISDKAVFCPHCGFVLQRGRLKTQIGVKKRKKLPNGFGQITEIKNKNLRKPFRVLVTVGKNDYGRPICKPLKPHSYFETYNEAYTALLEYNKKPFDLQKNTTMKDLYEKWLPYYKKRVTDKTYNDCAIAIWNYCTSIYNVPVREIRSSHIKYCIENGTIIKKGKTQSPSIIQKSKIKALLNMLLDYAIECDLTDRNYSRMLKLVIPEKYEVEKSHIRFSDEEMEILWNNVDFFECVDIILIQCYSGWRPQELLTIEIDNVNLDEDYFIGGMKTRAGKERTVPIHEKIKILVKRQYDFAKEIESDKLINYKTRKGSVGVDYFSYAHRFSKIIKTLGLDTNHRPHDPRVQFVTMAKEAKMDEYAIKKIIGHRIDDLTESTYSKRGVEWLKEEISKIK